MIRVCSNKTIGTCCYSYALVAIVLLAVTPVIASPVPTSLESNLQQREGSSERLALTWRVGFKEEVKPLSFSITSTQKQKWESASIKQYKQRGFTDKKAREMASTAFNSIVKQSQAPPTRNSAIWQFTRDNQQKILVAGTNPFTNGSAFKYRQFYDGVNGLIINDGDISQGGVVATVDPIVWSTSGQSWRFRSPAPFGLSVTPEQFVMLDGLNPLQIYGASWTVSSSTSKSWQLIGKVAETSNGPLTITLGIAIEGNDIVPQKITIKPDEEPWSINWQVLNYKRLNGVLMPSQVNFHSSAPGLGEVDETWTLTGVAPASPISVAINKKTFVHDYRLLGTALTQHTLLQADLQGNRNIVLYSWQGHFPRPDELKKIHQQQNPGESTPDLGKSSSALPFMGGLLCLVGGVWMFKRRGMA